MKTIRETNFKFPGQTGFYRGKVRDVYFIEGGILVMIPTDRISAFDVVLSPGIPGKGQMLNQISEMFLDATTDIVPNWKIASPHPMVMIGYQCEAFPIEMIVRNLLAGSAYQDYMNGIRVKSGVIIPDGMRENEAFASPIITPTTKAEQGLHDEDISKEEIIKQGLVSESDYALLEKYTMELFLRGMEIAKERGLLLVDTKYELGKRDGKIFLIDEIHTPDSSRYYYLEGYKERLKNEQPQKQLSKEFVRAWLTDNGFQGKEGQQMPEMTEEVINGITDRYAELFNVVTGKQFVPCCDNSPEAIEAAVLDSLSSLGIS